MIRVFALLLGALWLHSVGAATITAAGCNPSQIQTAFDASSNGDTVIIPDGACSWTTTLTLNKQITLTGASTGGTVITHMAGFTDLITINVGSSFHTTIANLRFMPGTGTGNYLTVQGDGQIPIMHHMYFNIPHFQLEHAVKWFVTGGLIYNTTFESTNNLDALCPTQIGSDSGSLVVKSNKGWDEASTMGALDTNGDQNLYIEDTVFSNVGQSPDVDDRGRVAIRHTRFIGSSGVTHGPTSAVGGRAVELYDNSFEYPNNQKNMNRWFWFRAGSVVITGNAIDAFAGQCYGNKDSFTFVVESARRSTNHGCCTDTSRMCFHQPGSGSDGTGGHQAILGADQSENTGFQISDPVHIWGNSGLGAASDRVSTNEGDPPTCGTTYSTDQFFKIDRDYFVNTLARPGWSRYPYPHPLRGGLAPPTNLVAGVSTVTASVVGGVSSCGVFVDSNPKVTVAAVSGVCTYSFTGDPTGVHTITMTSINAGQESTQSASINFTRPQIFCGMPGGIWAA